MACNWGARAAAVTSCGWWPRGEHAGCCRCCWAAAASARCVHPPPPCPPPFLLSVQLSSQALQGWAKNVAFIFLKPFGLDSQYSTVTVAGTAGNVAQRIRAAATPGHPVFEADCTDR